MLRYALSDCLLGVLIATETLQGLASIDLYGSQEEAIELVRASNLAQPLQRLDAAEGAHIPPALEAIQQLLAGDPGAIARLDVAFDGRGTPFQHKVWQQLRAIPAGATLTYGELARAIGSPGATRAVGTACAANPWAVLVPCHRVVRSDGMLGGYRWGLARKQALLTLESAFGAPQEREAATGGYKLRAERWSPRSQEIVFPNIPTS